MITRYMADVNISDAQWTYKAFGNSAFDDDDNKV